MPPIEIVPDKRALAPAVAEAFEFLKPRMELDGKKFILLAFDKEEFFVAANNKGNSYGITCAASCGRRVVLKVIKDYITQELSHAPSNQEASS